MVFYEYFSWSLKFLFLDKLGFIYGILKLELLNEEIRIMKFVIKCFGCIFDRM